MDVLPFRCSEQGSVVPSYLRQWHTGNGIGRSSLCCSSPRWRPPPGSGNISAREEEVRRVSIPDTLSSRPAPDPVGQTSARVSAVTEVWRQGGLSISNRHSLTTSWKPSSSSISGQASRMFTNKSNRTTHRPPALPLVFLLPTRPLSACPSLHPHHFGELLTDPARLFLLWKSGVGGEGEIVELYISLLELKVEFSF